MADDSTGDEHLHAAVSFEKVAGTLTLTHTELSWRPSASSSTSVPAFSLSHRFWTGLSVSVAGSASTVMLIKLDTQGTAPPPKRFASGKLILHFVAEPSEAAVAQREPFKQRLTNIIRQNKARAANEAGAAVASTPGPSSGPAPSPTSARSRDASMTAASSPASDARAQSHTDATSVSTTAAQKTSTAYDEPAARTELQMRIDILKAHPSLLALHRQVVHSRIMTDAEFWSHPTRLALLRAERAAEKQRKGRNARLADPQKSTDQGGEVRYSLTPQIVRDMFEQYPVVARAYAENVPDKLSEQDFWRRYFSSRLYSRLRTSNRSAASEHVIRDDEVFDKYLQEEDDDIEPRSAYNPHDSLLDLASTANDHDETGNQRDWTMRPGFGGGGKRALPLLRRFNEHSQSLLDSALGEQADTELDVEGNPRKKRRIVGGVGEEYPEEGQQQGSDADDDEEDDENEVLANQRGRSTRHLYSNIVIDELQEGQRRKTVPLNIQSASRRSKGHERAARPEASTGAGEPMDLDEDGEVSGLPFEVMQELIRTELEQWPLVPALGKWKPPQARDGMVRTMERLLNNVLGGAGRDFKHETGKGLLGDALHKSLLSSHAATTEFLRQFWSVVAPQSAVSIRIAKQEAAESQQERTVAELSPAQRRQRAVRMAGILAKTETRVNDLKDQVRQADAGVVEDRAAALAFVDRSLLPTVKAVGRALEVARVMYNFKISVA
ncbi:RNA polymerase II transcription factor B subunit 1 [Tilletia horrida]|nr:RNA polymerase II transcription factor B subunit 1 [Tilletia horrida]